MILLTKDNNNMSHLVEKPTMWFPNRSDTNRPVQLQKQARSLKFWSQVKEELYYLSSENKGADQFRLCRLLVFPWGGSYSKIINSGAMTRQCYSANCIIMRHIIKRLECNYPDIHDYGSFFDFEWMVDQVLIIGRWSLCRFLVGARVLREWLGVFVGYPLTEICNQKIIIS